MLGPLTKQNGITIIEVMITLLIISVGVMGSYQVASQGNSLERMSENRTKAVAYAREGLEVVENIRDTNWLKFSSNYEGCFDVLGYDVSCTGTSSGATGTVGRITSGSYVTTNTPTGAWALSGITIGAETEKSVGTDRLIYLSKFPLFLDGIGNTTQTGSTALPKCKNDIQTNCNTNFTREIRINRPGTNGILNPIEITSIVTWVDGKQVTPYVIEMRYTLYNWKNSFYKKIY